MEREVLSSSPWDPVTGRLGMGQSGIREGTRFDIRKHFFTERVVKHCNRFPRKVVNAPCLSVFKRYLDNALNSML